MRPDPAHTRRGLCAALLLACSLGTAAVAEPAPAPKVLRIAFSNDAGGFDPATLPNGISGAIAAHIFEPLYGYDHLARPVRLKPLTASSAAQHSADFRRWTVRIQPGIHFADDPAFQGRRRELTAADYVYAFKRIADPAQRSLAWTHLEQAGFSGLAALRQQARSSGKPFDYEREIEGLRAVDRYTLQMQLDAPRPRLQQTLAVGQLGAVAREVVQAYGASIDEHPVGTGPFRLGLWRRSSLIVLERNPGYRVRLYDAEPAPDDAEGQAIATRLRGRRLPMVDRVEIVIIDEAQPCWLSFLGGKIDMLEVTGLLAEQALPGGQLAPHLARRGVRAWRVALPTSEFTVFNMDDALVGGYAAPHVALRRAISLALDVERERRDLWHGQGRIAQSPIQLHTFGYDPAFRSENGDYSPARARALLDLYGYLDRDGDGWRERPDGAPLVLEMATHPTQSARLYDNLFQRDLNQVGLRVRFLTAPWPQQIKAVRAGQRMMWRTGFGGATPDPQGALLRYHGPATGGFNFARFRLPAMDAIFERLMALPDGPERLALVHEAKRLAVAYMPYKPRLHGVLTEIGQPWVDGYRRPLFWADWYHMVDVEARPAR